MCEGQQGGAIGLAVWPVIGCQDWHCWVTGNTVGLMEEAHWWLLLTVCSQQPCAVCHRDSEHFSPQQDQGRVMAMPNTPPHFLWDVSLAAVVWSVLNVPCRLYYITYLACLLGYIQMVIFTFRVK